MSSDAISHSNEVHIIGRLAAPAESRDLPSGDTVATLRVIVDRDVAVSRGRARVDTLDCAVWPAGLRRRVGAWRAGDLVEVHGAVRRRFYRSGAATVSRVEIELSAGRMVRRSRPPGSE